MSEVDGRIVFQIQLDQGNIKGDLDRITREISRTTQNWDSQTQDSSRNMQNALSRAFDINRIKNFALEMGKALYQLGAESVGIASDLQEVQNVVDVTFGSSANVIEQWSQNASKSFGLTELQAKRFTSTIGAMLKSSGLAGNEITKLSTDMAGLAADMASFYNLDFETAFQKIRSGLSGETEPLKQLGINMSVANLQAFALEKGLTKAFDKMSQSEQTMLRYQYLMSVTADAQGDFARTSDSYANSLRLLETNIDNLKAKLGGYLIDPLNMVVNSLNGLLELMSPVEGETIVDQVNGIQAQTAEKIEQIQQTAEEARKLVEVLEEVDAGEVANDLQKIGNSNAAEALQSISENLKKIDLSGDKTTVTMAALSQLQQDISAISAVTGQDAEGVTAWLNSVRESASQLAPDDVEGWTTLAQILKDGLPGLEDTEGGKSLLQALGAGIEDNAASVSAYLTKLGIDSSAVADKQQLWLEVCRRLVQTIPGLSSLIDTQTGEIRGGIQALSDYIDAWQETETKAALLEEIALEREALNEQFGKRYSLKIDVATAEREIERLKGRIEQIPQAVRDSADQKKRNDNSSFFGTGLLANSVYTKEESDYLSLLDQREKAEKRLSQATSEYTEYMDDYAAALAVVQEREETVQSMYEDTTESINAQSDAIKDWDESTKTAVTDAVRNANDALQALSEHVESVRASVAASVDSVVSGFNRLQRPTQAIDDRISELSEALANETNAEKRKELEAQIEELNRQTINPENMRQGLQSQLAFMEEYMKNLETLRKLGVSDEMLAFLSDGSLESGEYIKQLIQDPTGEVAREIDGLYQQVQAKKEQFTNTLTDQQLSVDQVYNALAEKVKETVAALDQGQEAANQSGKTIQGIAEGISTHLPDVQDAVDAILSELNRLNGWGVNISLGPLGDIGISLGQVPQLAIGMDHVPYDGFLASLHEGEAVLTAEENMLWQRFKNGETSTRNVDYDRLGGVMRDNVRTGGNVYLEGRVVGSVISEMQGKSYKALKRSGWAE